MGSTRRKRQSVTQKVKHPQKQNNNGRMIVTTLVFCRHKPYGTTTSLPWTPSTRLVLGLIQEHEIPTRKHSLVSIASFCYHRRTVFQGSCVSSMMILVQRRQPHPRYRPSRGRSCSVRVKSYSERKWHPLREPFP